MLYTLIFSSQCYPHFLQPVLYTFSFSPASATDTFSPAHHKYWNSVSSSFAKQVIWMTNIPTVKTCQQIKKTAAAGCVLLETEQWHPPSFTRWSSKRAFSTRGVQRALARIWPVTMASFLRSSSLNPFWNTSTCNKVASSPHMNKSASFREETRAKNSHGSNNGPWLLKLLVKFLLPPSVC